MKKSFLLLLLLFTVTTFNAQNNNEQTKVHQSVAKFFDGFSALDTIIVKQYSANDFILLEDGVVWNIDSIKVSFHQLKDQLKGASLVRVNHFDFIKTEVKGNSAWVAYNNTADFTFNNVKKRKIEWLESTFLVKEGNIWKIKLLHSTILKPSTQ